MRVIVLLSGGIDSPVAAHLLQKAGCDVIGVHFHNQTRQQVQVQSKVEQLVTQIGLPKLWLVPFKDLQLAIIKAVPAEFRMIVYRRMMLKIADKIREKEQAQALATGDSIGQVASQTLENLQVSYAAVKTTILHPLIGMDKQEITDIAKSIGTYDISALPYEDCCSFMIAKHPATKSRLEEIEHYEKALPIAELIEKTLETVQIIQPEAQSQKSEARPLQNA